jgi:hypothetical protein
MKNTQEWRVVRGFPNYEISNDGEVRNIITGKLCKVNENLTKGEGRVYLYESKGVKKTRGISTLMCDNWKYEFIKDLEDDEECKECYGCKGWFITTKGRIFSTHYYRWLEPKHSHSYYWVVNYKGTCHPVHTLVGRTFCKDYQDGLLILHNEEELPYPMINYLSNLRVGTYSDNNKDTWDKGRNHHPGFLTEEHKEKLRKPKRCAS